MVIYDSLSILIGRISDFFGKNSDIERLTLTMPYLAVTIILYTYTSERFMKKVFFTVISLLITISLLGSFASCAKVYVSEYSTNLELDDKGEFKILTLSDLHFMNAADGKEKDRDDDMFYRMDLLVNNSDPDLIVLLGDMVYCDNKIPALERLIEKMDNYKKPWACVYGNHDPENANNKEMTRQDSDNNKLAMNEVLIQSEYCLFKAGPENINGSGNYTVNIVNDKKMIIQTLFFLDSGDYIRKYDIDNNDFIPASAISAYMNYGSIYPNQIEWYENTIKDIARCNRRKTVPSMAFFHIPLPEYKTVWKLYQEESDEVKWYDGRLEEFDILDNGGVTSPSFNTGMFDKMVQLKSTKAVFTGHDHGNDFSIEYKGIRLNYNGGLRHITYALSDKTIESMFGGREIIIKEDGSFIINRLLIKDLIEQNN